MKSKLVDAINKTPVARRLIWNILDMRLAVTRDLEEFSGSRQRKKDVAGVENGRTRCLNVGDTNTRFRRKGWVTADLVDADFLCDFRSDPLPFADGSFESIHASHVVEHLSVEQTAGLLSEIHRCLKPGGRIRLATPDLDLLADRYRANDWKFFLDVGGRYILSRIHLGDLRPESLLIQNLFVGWIASYSGRLDTGGGPLLEKETVDERLANMDLEAFRDFCVSRLEPDRTYAHIHVFRPSELMELLAARGFRNVRRMEYGQSDHADFVSPPIDVPHHRPYSLYVEAEK